MPKSAGLFAALLIAGTLFSATAQAQVRLGVKAGANYSGFSTPNTGYPGSDPFNRKLGFHAGVMANVDVSGDGIFSVQPELLYSQKGFSVDDETTQTIKDSGLTETVVSKNKGNVNYNYLDLPVLLKINARGLIFEAGPQVSYLLAVHDRIKSTVNGTVVKYDPWATTKNSQRLDLGYAAGLGYQLAAGPLVGLRYNGSFRDLDRNGHRNQVYQLYVGYLLGAK
ncbi:porin family protein [Hymenobacter persicinus]|uniref:PorT family protein n=1 Tax=Hymenobacter persicinus TaxID=2025506 RepID=A0A4Q5LCB0_9BACT|nr:porin family protein [Hymenobacter persicinus]RYU80272.1 PorT family protein [Hymenobacter persicinus]